MKSYKNLTAAVLLPLCFSVSLLHNDVFSNTSQVPSEFTAQSAAQPDTTGKHRLVQLATDRGWVRIIVTWKMDGHEREGLLGQGQRHAQREDIQQLQQQRVAELEAKNLNINVLRNMQLNPRTAMTVDEEAILYLFDSSKVLRIVENRIGGTFDSESTESGHYR